jgi:hypothetical protein
VGRMEFGPSVLPELRKILLSAGEGKFFGPDGRLIEVKQVPFLEEWHLDGLDFDPDLGWLRSSLRRQTSLRQNDRGTRTRRSATSASTWHENSTTPWPTG